MHETDNTAANPRRRAALITGETGRSLHAVTAGVAGVAEAARAPRAWYVAMALSLCLLGTLGLMVLYLFITGVGVWNLNRPVCWAFDITNFVFWVGIGH